MKGVLMDASYIVVSVIMLVVLVASIPTRVKSKVTYALHKLGNGLVPASRDSESAKYVFRMEIIASIALLGVVAVMLAFGYIAPHAGWYTFEIRIPLAVIASAFVLLYIVRAVNARKVARSIETERHHSKEKGVS